MKQIFDPLLSPIALKSDLTITPHNEHKQNNVFTYIVLISRLNISHTLCNTLHDMFLVHVTRCHQQAAWQMIHQLGADRALEPA